MRRGSPLAIRLLVAAERSVSVFRVERRGGFRREQLDADMRIQCAAHVQQAAASPLSCHAGATKCCGTNSVKKSLIFYGERNRGLNLVHHHGDIRAMFKVVHGGDDAIRERGIVA